MKIINFALKTWDDIEITYQEETNLTVYQLLDLLSLYEGRSYLIFEFIITIRVICTEEWTVDTRKMKQGGSYV